MTSYTQLVETIQQREQARATLNQAVKQYKKATREYYKLLKNITQEATSLKEPAQS